MFTLMASSVVWLISVSFDMFGASVSVSLFGLDSERGAERGG